MNKIFLEERGELIYLFRHEKGLSQADLAKALNVNQSIISNAERGQFKKTQEKVIILIKSKYKVEPDFFIPKEEKVELSPAQKDITEKLPPQYLELVGKYVDEVTMDYRETIEGVKQLIENHDRDYGKLIELNNQYMESINKSFRAYIKLRKYLEETPDKKLDKEKLLKGVNELGTILFENYE